MDILIEVSENIFADEMKVQKKILEDMEMQFKREFEVETVIKPVEKGSLKSEKVVDDRR